MPFSVLRRCNMRVRGASGFHAFRHTAGSVVEERTGRLKLAQKLLRHSNISTTADTYTHTSRQSDREATVALERAYFGDLFPILGTGTRTTRSTKLEVIVTVGDGWVSDGI